MLRKRLLYLILGCAIFVQSILLAFLPRQSVSALSGEEMLSTMRSYSYYSAFHSCLLAGQANSTYNTNDPASLIMKGDYWVTIGRVVPTDGDNNDGGVTCQNAINFIIGELNISKEDLLRELGYEFNATNAVWSLGRTCTDAQGRTTWCSYTSQEVAGRFKALAERNGLPTSEPDYGWYQFAYTAFSAACSAQRIDTLDQVDQTIRSQAESSSNGYYVIKEIPDTTGASVSVVYKIQDSEKNNSHYTYARPTDTRAEQGSATCAQMARDLNGDAASRAAYAIGIEAGEEAKKKAESVYAQAIINAFCKDTPATNAVNCSSNATDAVRRCMNSYFSGSLGGQSRIITVEAVNNMDLNALAGCIAPRIGYDAVSVLAVLKSASENATTQIDDLETESPVDNGAVCTGGSLGWVLCPIATLFQNLVDVAAGVIGDLMEINPIGSNNDLLNVWRTFVGIANLLLVVGFIIVIFSQATSVGLSAYGIKKMLPRIIAAAILINLSYFICTLALDLTNIVGKSVGGIINSLPVDVETGTTTFTPGATWASNVTALVLGAVGIYMLTAGWVAFIVPVLITGGLAVLSILLIIALRQVLVILLVILAPLAFAAMILPNTESLFTKWRKLFINMLVMYPVAMFLLYGSGLVGQLVQVASTGQDDDPSAMLTQMVAFVIMTIGPFAGLYMYLKNSNKLMSMATGAIGKIGAGIKGWGNDWAKQTKGNISNRQTAWMQNSNRGLAQFGKRFDPRMAKIRRDAVSSQYEEAAKLAGARTANQYVEKKYGTNSVQGARAAATLAELDMKEAKIKLDFQFKGDPVKALEDALSRGDKSLLQLSAGKLTDTAQLGALQETMLTDSRFGNKEVASVMNYLKENHFTKVKDQDLGMMYAMVDPAGLGDETKAKSELKILMDGGSRYDLKAMGASDAAIGGQEKYVLDRQTGWNDDPAVKAYTKPAVLDPTRSERILDDPNLKGQIKEGQRDILAAATASSSPHHKPHP